MQLNLQSGHAPYNSDNSSFCKSSWCSNALNNLFYTMSDKIMALQIVIEFLCDTLMKDQVVHLVQNTVYIYMARDSSYIHRIGQELVCLKSLQEIVHLYFFAGMFVIDLYHRLLLGIRAIFCRHAFFLSPGSSVCVCRDVHKSSVQERRDRFDQTSRNSDLFSLFFSRPLNVA